MFLRQQQLEEPWPGQAYTSHICRFDVFPRFDPERTKFDGKTNKRKYDAPNDSGKKGVNLRQENSKRRKLDKTASGEMSPVDAGVCVHVQSGKVSLEFCAECSIKASSIIN